MSEKEPWEYSAEEIEKLLKEGKRYRHLRKQFEQPGVEFYIRKWGPPLFCFVVGFSLGWFFKRPEYRSFPPRLIEGSRWERWSDSIYYMNVRIDSAVENHGQYDAPY
jgi:hypothetical protein